MGGSLVRGRRARATAGRGRSVKSKIIALVAVPLVALILLWVFAASVTLGDSLRLLRARTFDAKVVRPTEALIGALQNERRMSLAFLGNDPTLGRVGFDAQRVRTDQVRAAFVSAARSGELAGATTAETRKRMGALAGSLTRLEDLRAAVERRQIGRQQSFAQFTALIDAADAVYDAVYPGEPEIAQRTRTLLELERARESLSREDALLTGALIAGGPTADERAQIIQLAGVHRFRYAELVRALPAADRARYEQVTAGREFTALADLEDRFMRDAERGKGRAIDGGSWHTASEAVLARLVDFEAATRAGISAQAHDRAVSVLARLALAGGLGLVAVIASLLIALRTGRRLIRENRAIAGAVYSFATDRLPEITERVRRGETVDPDHGAPVFDFRVREVRSIYQAFSAARRAVVTASMSEAAARRGLSEVFVNLARRNQVLLHRLLNLLDGMEQRAGGPEELNDLFALDHLATRMRRHAEGLVILSGRFAGRTWRSPVAFVDVMRAAASEVEEYTRVKVTATGEAALSGPAVADVIHLLAELIENATQYSPPDLPVQVTGQSVAHGFALEVEDRGLGVEPEPLAEINRRLAEAPDFDLFDSARLGLFVVARLARRHDIEVTLRRSPFGGTSAVVLVPASLVVSSQDAGSAGSGGAETPLVPGRHRLRADEMVASAPVTLAPAAGGQVALMPGGAAPVDDLPRRTRQASLAPQLREAAQAPARVTDPAPPPEVVRNRMAAMQEGWRRGRAADAGELPDAPTPPVGGEDPR